MNKIILILLLNLFAPEELLQDNIVGVVDISLKTTREPVLFNNINLRTMISGFSNFDEIQKFGEPVTLEIKESPAESDYFYKFKDFDLTVVQITEKPQLTDFVISKPGVVLKVGNLHLSPGMSLDDLGLPFQEFAEEHNILPEFGSLSINKIDKYVGYSSAVRIIYNLETDEITKVMLLANPL